MVFNNGAGAEKVSINSAEDGDFNGKLGSAATLAIRNGAGSVQMPAHSAEIFVAAK